MFYINARGQEFQDPNGEPVQWFFLRFCDQLDDITSCLFFLNLFFNFLCEVFKTNLCNVTVKESNLKTEVDMQINTN